MPIGQLDGTVQVAVADQSIPGSTPQGQAASTTNNIAANSVPIVGNGLMNPSGSFDRQREALTNVGQALVSDPTVQQQLTQIAALLRAHLYATVLLINAVSSPAVAAAGFHKLDMILVGDILAAVTNNQSVISDVETLQ
jgi:hypothetical protein